MRNDLLEKVGFSFYNKKDFFPKEVTLRKGKQTIVWVHRLSGHGILDPENWEHDEYYEEEYRQEFSANSDGKKNETDEHFNIFRDLNRKQFDTFSDILKQDTSFLEVGPSHGGIIDYVIKKGVKSCHAVEPNKEDASYLKEKYSDLYVYNSLLEKAEIQNNYYDVAASFEVLEHTVRPLTFLQKIKYGLKKGGTLVLEVPNHNDVLLSCYKENTNYKDFYYHKAHIHYFTPTSLNDLCRYCGFEGATSSFLMYPFFNHVSWHHNSGPQPTAKIALSTPEPADSWTMINDFYKKVEKEYEKLINLNMIGDCLIYRGKKI